jgi:mRNA interferase MazF
VTTPSQLPTPRRGEVWFVRLDAKPVGHEQAGERPAVVVSIDTLNASGAGLVFVVPLTTKRKAVRSHVAIAAGEGGLTKPSFAKVEDTKSVSKLRLIRRLGRVRPATLQAIEVILRHLLSL